MVENGGPTCMLSSQGRAGSCRCAYLLRYIYATRADTDRDTERHPERDTGRDTDRHADTRAIGLAGAGTVYVQLIVAQAHDVCPGADNRWRNSNLGAEARRLCALVLVIVELAAAGVQRGLWVARQPLRSCPAGFAGGQRRFEHAGCRRAALCRPALVPDRHFPVHCLRRLEELCCAAEKYLQRIGTGDLPGVPNVCGVPRIRLRCRSDAVRGLG